MDFYLECTTEKGAHSGDSFSRESEQAETPSELKP